MIRFLRSKLRPLDRKVGRTPRWRCTKSISAALLCLGVSAADVPGFTNAISYVRLLQDQDTLEVSACGPGRAAWRAASERFRDFRREQKAIAARTGAGECFEYRFALRAAAQSGRSRDVQRIGKDLMASADAWLFVPRKSVPHEIVFDLPPGVHVSAPWEPLDSHFLRYRADAPGDGSKALIVFGSFVRRVEHLPGTRLEIAMLDGTPSLDEPQVIEWVKQAAQHVTLVYGAFPVARVQVLIVPVLGVWPTRDRTHPLEAVPFARVMRDGGFTVQFFVNQSAPLSEYLADWTATHEFSHLLLPYVRRSDGWISEGFASYYQNVLMARGGVLDERRAWQKLLEGFDRGRRGLYRDTLAESIRRRGPNMLMRMYWSGAAVALMADVELRRTNAASSLDATLARLRDCCLDHGPVWKGGELFKRLDASSGSHVFAPLYERTAGSTRFPDVDPVLIQLGVTRERGNVALDDSAPLAAIRRAIMTGVVSTRRLPNPPPAQGRVRGND